MIPNCQFAFFKMIPHDFFEMIPHDFSRWFHLLILSRPICGTPMRVAKIQNGSSNNAGTRPLEQNSEIMFLFFWPWFLHASPFSLLLPLLLLSETFDFLQTFPPPTTTLSQPKTPQIPLRRTSSCVYKLIDRRESWGSFFRCCKVSGGSGHRYFLHE